MKILTLNTHSLVDDTIPDPAGQTAALIADRQIDLIALQEVNQTIVKEMVQPPELYVGQADLREDNYALELSRALSRLGCLYEWTWFPMKVGYDRYDEGLALFSRLPIMKQDNFLLSKTNDYHVWKKRDALGIEVVSGEDSCWIYTMHMGWWNDEEEPFLPQWQRFMEHVPSGKIFLAGDFNAPDDRKNESYETILGDGWLDTRTLADQCSGRFTTGSGIDGWNQAREGMRIDYIFTNQQMKITNSEVVFDGKKTPRISDHFGLLMEE